ncbi:MAG: MFS transporter [Anaerolineaceae bacterium]|nr:MFS transporter [Anaerolineaceae bacterium]
MKIHPMFKTLINFKGNARGCVYTEALNGIPNSLLAPYVSVYMLALGINDEQIGLWLSVGWVFQLIMAVFGGVITDKLGRRKTTLIFDIFAWTIPAIIFAFAQTYWHFLAAAVMASFLRVAANAWTCLMVEDAEADELIDIFTWIQIMCLTSAYFVPLAGLLIMKFDLIPAVRMMYLFAALSFTVKAFLTYRLTTETTQGLVRMEQTRGKSLFSSLKEYDGVFKIIFNNPASLITMGIMAIMSISTTINGTFWSVIVTEKIGIPAEHIAIYPFAKSIVMLLFFFLVIPRMKTVNFKIPMMVGFSGFLFSQLILVLVPQANYGVLLISILFEACSLATVTPLLEQMTIVTIDAKERARIQSILYVAVILITSPFGWIAGLLSAQEKALPFVLNMILLSIGVFLAYLAGKVAEKQLFNANDGQIAC